MRFQHNRAYSVGRARIQRRMDAARGSGPAGISIPLISFLVILGLIALNIFLPGFLGNPVAH